MTCFNDMPKSGQDYVSLHVLYYYFSKSATKMTTPLAVMEYVKFLYNSYLHSHKPLISSFDLLHKYSP